MSCRMTWLCRPRPCMMSDTAETLMPWRSLSQMSGLRASGVCWKDVIWVSSGLPLRLDGSLTVARLILSIDRDVALPTVPLLGECQLVGIDLHSKPRAGWHLHSPE